MAAAVAAGAAAPKPPGPGVVLPPLVAAVDIAGATAIVGGLLAQFMEQRRGADESFLLAQLAPRTRVATDIETVIAEERVRGETFRKLAEQRLRRDLPVALAIPDPAQREAAVRGIMQREAVYQRMRSEAMAARGIAAVDRMVLRRDSPTGAFWKLDPTVQEHTAGCLIMGGRFWGWPILDRVHPPRHAGCPCHLLSYGEAIKLGLLVPGAVLDLADQIKAAAGVVMESTTADDLLDELRETGGIVGFAKAEFEKAKHPRDGKGQFANTPDAPKAAKVWASAVAAGETAPAAGSMGEKVADWMAGWSHDGTSTRLTTVHVRNGMTRVEGEFVRGGEKVGSFTRDVRPAIFADSPGWEVYHDSVQAGAKAKPGHATQFVRDSEAAYPGMGIKTASLSAQWAKGGYVWAREGWDFDTRRKSREAQLDTMWNERGWYVLNGPAPEALRTEFERKIKAHEFLHPWELAAFGADQPFEYGGRTTWLGRLFMEGNAWLGIKELA